MGAEHAVFERDAETTIGLTGMTVTLAEIGYRLTGALCGGPRFAWGRYLLLWVGLVAGAATGAALYPMFGLDALWLAAGASAIGAFAVLKI